MKVLITGFEPFGNDTLNPSQLAVNSLPDKINNIEIKKVILPTAFLSSSETLKENIELSKPNIVICVGQAGGKKDISLERVAINIDDARIPDNEDYSPIDKTIRIDGKNAYFSTLPIKAIVEKLKANNISASISNTAGTYVCNHIMYDSLYFADNYYPDIKTGFIHIPFIREQVNSKPGVPFMELNDIVKALEISILTACEFYNKQDITVTGGKED